MPFALPRAGRVIAAWDAPAVLRRLVRRCASWHRPPPPNAALPPIAAPIEPAAAVATPTRASRDEALAAARADWADRLWEAGFLIPGGEAEILRLLQLLPLSPATTLLLVGRDAGGAARTVAQQQGAWVAAHQHDPLLAERMAQRLRPLGKRITVQPWDPAAPGFRHRFHHHALALEPLRAGVTPAALAQALAAALKPGGQLVLVETIAAAPPDDQAVALDRWWRLEPRAAPPPDRAVIEAALRAAGFTLHVAEDIGARQGAAATEAWSRLVGGLKQGRPGAIAAAALVTDAEAWLLRQRLLTAGALRVLRWHASLPG